MSHVASVKCFVTDLNALEAVAKKLGMELVRDAKTYAWFGSWVGDFRGSTAAVDNGHRPEDFGKCVHKLRRADHQQGMYEIGVVARVDGKPGFELVYDNWGSGGAAIETKCGKGLATLKNELAAEVTLRTMIRQGYRVTRSVDTKTGAIVMTATK